MDLVDRLDVASWLGSVVLGLVTGVAANLLTPVLQNRLPGLTARWAQRRLRQLEAERDQVEQYRRDPAALLTYLLERVLDFCAAGSTSVVLLLAGWYGGTYDAGSPSGLFLWVLVLNRLLALPLLVFGTILANRAINIALDSASIAHHVRHYDDYSARVSRTIDALTRASSSAVAIKSPG